MIERAIFANDVRVSQVERTHKELGDIFEGLSLEETFVVGYNWKREKILDVKNSGKLKELIDFFYKWDYHNSSKQLSSFRLYNQPAITRHARFRAEFMRKAKAVGYDLSKPINVTKLEELSYLGAEYATVLYALKCYALAHYNERLIEQYKGLQPQTGPVYNANDVLFGKNLSVTEHTKHCNDIAVAIDKSPMFVNTAFYFMG